MCKRWSRYTLSQKPFLQLSVIAYIVWKLRLKFKLSPYLFVLDEENIFDIERVHRNTFSSLNTARLNWPCCCYSAVEVNDTVNKAQIALCKMKTFSHPKLLYHKWILKVLSSFIKLRKKPTALHLQSCLSGLQEHGGCTNWQSSQTEAR